jgi:hypothetical protein
MNALITSIPTRRAGKPRSLTVYNHAGYQSLHDLMQVIIDRLQEKHGEEYDVGVSIFYLAIDGMPHGDYGQTIRVSYFLTDHAVFTGLPFKDRVYFDI